jgi:hypothetical protein
VLESERDAAGRLVYRITASVFAQGEAGEPPVGSERA